MVLSHVFTHRAREHGCYVIVPLYMVEDGDERIRRQRDA